jgi:pimeloyl-ACP methyl ester carboxylesterase
MMKEWKMIQIIKGKYDNNLSFIESGQAGGYPILVQHGLIASITDQTMFDRLLRKNFRLICIARPGYGESSPYLMHSYADWGDIISTLVQRLNLVRFDVLGISSGAPYAYAIGKRYTEQTRNIYILSGMPALYDESVRSNWPYPLEKESIITDMQKLANQLFFANLNEIDKENADVQDSMRNNAFGVAQDLRLRGMDWGFCLSDLKQKVFMRHSRSDESVPFQTAVRTSELIPDCRLELTEYDPHFSQEVLDEFIDLTIFANTGESTP